MTKQTRQHIFSLGEGVRRQLRALAHEIYDRMVMEEHVEENNRTENILTVGLYSFIAFSVGAVFYLAAISTNFLDKTKLGDVDPLVAAIGVGFGAMLISLIGFGSRISDFGLRIVGRSQIYMWRRLPGKKNGQRRAEMLEIVEEWLRSNPAKPAREVEQRFGAGMTVDKIFPGALTRTLKRLSRKKSGLDYIVLRGLVERKYKAVYGARWFRSKRPNAGDPDSLGSYYVRARDLRNALKVNLILHLLGADLRDETPDGDNWKREYFTNPLGQQLTLWDENDLPTRFRTFGPHLRWPKDGATGHTSSVGEAPSFVAVMGVENPLRIPLFLLTVDEIYAAMPRVAAKIYDAVRLGAMAPEEARDQAIKVLLHKPVPMFAKKDRKTLRALGGVDAPEITVMREYDGGYELRWDANRILWDQLDPAASSDLMQALALVLAAIDLCSEGDATTPPTARRVTLARGDLLITDNQRTLVCRREADFYGDNRRLKLAAGMPPQWWLRGFYGFRMD